MENCLNLFLSDLAGPFSFYIAVGNNAIFSHNCSISGRGNIALPPVCAPEMCQNNKTYVWGSIRLYADDAL